MTQWTLQDAKTRFCALVEAALAGQPQQVITHSETAVVVLSMNEYDRLHNRSAENASSFIEHLLTIPSGDDNFEFERIPLSSRPLKESDGDS